MQPPQILDEAGLEQALTARSYLLFKHSLICPISTRAFREYQLFIEGAGEVPTGWIDVIAQRPWARAIADRTGVAHESPQAFLLQNGQVKWTGSHGGITRATLESALDAAKPT